MCLTDRDIEAYQLSTKVFDMLGFEKSYVQKFQSKYKPGYANYDDDLENIEYDMLYGQRYMYPDGWPYEPTNMTVSYTHLDVYKRQAITIVMAVPTVISGVYGMNVGTKWMPFANVPYGFEIVCGIILVIRCV